MLVPNKCLLCFYEKFGWILLNNLPLLSFDLIPLKLFIRHLIAFKVPLRIHNALLSKPSIEFFLASDLMNIQLCLNLIQESHLQMPDDLLKFILKTLFFGMG